MSTENTNETQSGETETQVAKEETKVVPGLAQEVTLSDGRKAQIFKGKGIHARKAMRAVSDTKEDSGAYLSSLMSMLIIIDGKELVPEEFDELPMKDYNELMRIFTEINF